MFAPVNPRWINFVFIDKTDENLAKGDFQGDKEIEQIAFIFRE